MKELLQLRRVFGEQLTPATGIVGSKTMVQLHLAQITIHKQHLQAEIGKGLAQQGHQCRFAFATDSGRDCQHAQAAASAQQLQRAVKVAQGFPQAKALLIIQLGPQCCNGLRSLQRQKGNTPQQRLLNALFHIAGAVEHVIKPVANKRCSRARHQTQQHPKEQASREIGLHRCVAKHRWTDHLPGQGFLGHLQAEAFAGFQVAAEVFLGNLKPLIQGVVLLHQLRTHHTEGQHQLGQLALHLRLLGGVFLQGRPHRIQLTLHQQGAQLVALGCEALHQGRTAAEAATGLCQLLFHIDEISQQLAEGTAGQGTREITASSWLQATGCLLELGGKQLAAAHRGLQAQQLRLALLEIPRTRLKLGTFRFDLPGPVFRNQQGIGAAEIGQVLLDAAHPLLQPWCLLIEELQALGQLLLALPQRIG